MRTSVCLLLLLIAGFAGPLGAQDSSSGRSAEVGRSEKPADQGRGGEEKVRPQKGNDEKVPGFTLEREAAALSFVDQHHPELSELLVKLKKSNRRGYQQAINELFRTSERLANSKERDSTRYEFELRIWKLDSRIRLLAARMSMSSNQALQEELKALLLEKADVQIEQKLFERERLATRLEKLDASIERARQEREAQAQESLDVLLRDIKQWQPAKAPQRSGAVPARSSSDSLDTTAKTAHR